MKLNRLTVLVTILVVVSVGSNIFTFWFNNNTKIWPTELTYSYHHMFLGSALMHRPPGTEGLALLDMDKAIITVTEFGPPMNCATLNIHTGNGTIHGACVEGKLDE